ncbi:hypothetical protein ACO0R3_002067 [Hanseniaspora guilliermondii]
MNNTNINPIIGSVVQVANPYKKNLEDEIDLQIGDQIQIILDDEEYNDGWYYGKNLRTNLIGLFPKCFTESLDDNLKKDYNKSQRNFSANDKPTENGFRKESNNSTQSFYRVNEKRMFSSSSNLSRSHSSFMNNNQSASQIRTTSNNSVNRSLSRLNSKNVSSLSVDQEEQDEVLIQQLMKLCDMDAVLETRNIKSWEPEDVAVYFYNKNIDLDSCLKFYDHKINSKILFSLTQQDLKNELEILSFGSRFSISKEIDHLKLLAEQPSDEQIHSGKRFDKSNSFSNKNNEYDHSSSPSMRSSRRSSLLLPAATVRNRSSSQSTNDSVILNNTNMDTIHNINKLAYNNVERTPSNKYNGYTDYPNVTRNGTQNYRSTSGNLVPTLSISKRNNPDYTPVKNGLGLNLSFESPRKPPAPPSISSPISQKVAGSPDGQFGKIGNIYENTSNNHSGDKIYRNGSSNNSTSNMLKRSTSFLQRNLSFRSTPSRSRNITPSAATDESGPLLQPKAINNDKNYQTPKNNERNFDLNLTPKAAVKSDALIKPQFLDTPNQIVEPIYQPPSNISQNNTNMDSLKDLNDTKGFMIKSNHKKNESGGSFLDLFSKLESMNVNSAVNTPTMPLSHKFLPPAKSSLSQPSTADSAATSVYDNRSSVYEAPGMRYGHTRDTSSVYAHSRNNTIGVNSINQENTNDILKKPNEGLSAGSGLTGTDDNSLTNFNEVDESSKDDSFVDFSKDNNEKTLNSISEETVSKPLHTLNTSFISSTKPVESMTAAEKLKEFKANRAKKVMNYSRTCKESIKTANVHGWMGKRNSKSGVRGLNTWKRRYFVLTGTRLSYYADPDNDAKEKGIIDITGYSVLPVNVSADSNKNERLITFLSSTMSSKSNYFFKIVPPKPGSKKNANFTQQKTYYFSVETVEEIKLWMNAMLKATIDIDTSVPIISSCDIPTISLDEAQSMLEKARKDISLGNSQTDSPDMLKVSGDEYLQRSEEENRDDSENNAGYKDSSLDPFKS